MMYDIKESVLMSLDGRNVELYPYLPYLLKDLWEIGTSPEHIIELLDRQDRDFHDSELLVLDLGCGKGATVIPLAKKYGFSTMGIDAVSEFIQFARDKAGEWDMVDKCRFEVGDIREYVQKCGPCDIIILGSIGPVLGNIQQTLTILAKTLKPGGIVLLDDAYIPDGSEFYHNGYLPEAQFMKQIRRSGFEITDMIVYDNAAVIKDNEEIYRHIRRRAEELSDIYPGLRYIFEDYLATQRIKNKILEDHMICAVMLMELNHNHSAN